MRILTWDIENSPMLAYTWGMLDVSIGTEMVVKPMETMCFAAQWYGDKQTLFYSTFHDGRTNMIQAAHDLLNEADGVVSWNGIKHDSPHLHREFLQAGMMPPAPYQDIDLLTTSRKRFKFESNKLDYVAQRLGIGKKVEHEGFPLWIKCMEGDEQAWARMRKYNIQDVKLTSLIYDQFRPWIKTHPSYAAQQGEDVCPKCGSKHFTAQGTRMTATGSYPRFQCQDCGSWFKGNKRLGSPTL